MNELTVLDGAADADADAVAAPLDEALTYKCKMRIQSTLVVFVLCKNISLNGMTTRPHPLKVVFCFWR